MSDIRVLVVDDQHLVRDGIASLLDLQPGLTVVGTAADGVEAVEAVGTLAPDVVLMDIRMPRLDGVGALRRLREQGAACRVVMLTTFDDDEYVLAALRHGADGYLLKSLPAAELTRAVRLVHAGVAQIDGGVARGLTAALARATPSAPPALSAPAAQPAHGVPPARAVPPAAAAPPVDEPPDLTRREADVVRLVATGATNREIARRLFVSEGTVKNHISRILARWSLRDRTQLALAARDRGLV